MGLDVNAARVACVCILSLTPVVQRERRRRYDTLVAAGLWLRESGMRKVELPDGADGEGAKLCAFVLGR